MYSCAAHWQLTGNSLWLVVPSAGSVGRDDQTQLTGELSRSCRHFWLQLCACNAQEESYPRRLKRGEGWQSHRVCQLDGPRPRGTSREGYLPPLPRLVRHVCVFWNGRATAARTFGIRAVETFSHAVLNQNCCRRPAHAYNVFGLDVGRAMATYSGVRPSHARAPVRWVN